MRLQRSMSAAPRAEAGITLCAALNPRHYHNPRPWRENTRSSSAA